MLKVPVTLTIVIPDAAAARRILSVQFRRNLIGHPRQMGARHAHLRAGEPTDLGLVQPRLEHPRGERGG